jgi:hypothetical protein
VGVDERAAGRFFKGVETMSLDRGTGHDFHVVEVRHGNASYFPETYKTRTGFAAVVEDILSAQVENVLRVYAFNAVEGWARDVSADISRAVANKAAHENLTVTESTRDFIEERAGFAMARGLQLTSGEFVAW